MKELYIKISRKVELFNKLVSSYCPVKRTHKSLIFYKQGYNRSEIPVTKENIEYCLGRLLS